MMCYRKREVEKGLFRGDPAERTDREIVILSLASGELCSKVGEGKELVGSIKFFVVLAVAALHLAIVPRGIRPDGFVPDA